MTHDPNEGPENGSSGGSVSRASLIAATVLVTLIAALICLIPKPENDLFFILRIGGDILDSRQLPYADTYSWVNRGTRWDLPEWLSFVVYALAFRAGGFFGTWMVMVLLTIATALVVWFWLAARTGVAWAFPLTMLMLLAMSDGIQERPYAFTYLLLAVSVVILTRAREGRPRLLLRLPPLCAPWTNLHQGVLVLICLLLAYALGEAITAAWLRRQNEWPETWPRHAGGAGLLLGTAVACTCAGMISPYGPRVYWNVFITLRNNSLMSNVTEWNSVAVLPISQMQPFLVISLVVFGSLALSQRRSLADILAVAALFGEALLHVRNIALFAVASMVIVAPHLASSLRQMRRHLHLSPRPVPRSRLLTAFALFYTALIALMSLVNLRREIGPRGYSLAGIGEAVAQVPRYPQNACAFMEAQGFPPSLRLYNNFEIGGYLMWRLPRQPVFVDGRLDVYVGRTFDDMLVLTHGRGSPAWSALVDQYDFDCVITTSGREARTFAADPQWQLVYTDPKGHKQRCRILLRRRPEFIGLIARCLRDRPLLMGKTDK